MGERKVSKIDFETRLRELSASFEPFADMQMLVLSKFAVATGVFVEEEYTHWRKQAKSVTKELSGASQ